MNRRPIFLLSYILGGFILFLSMPTTIRALDPKKAITQYNIKIWHTENGLPDNSVYTILQTRDGYIWMGTLNGVVRFDGYTFHSFDSEESPRGEIRALYEDSVGTLWIGTTSYGLYSYKHGKFKQHIENVLKIRSIQEDRQGKLWIGCFGEDFGLIEYDKVKNLTYFNDKDEPRIPNNKINSIAKDDRGDLWVTTEKGIIKLDEHGKPGKTVYGKRISAKLVVSLVDTTSKTLWIGSGGSGGLYRVHLDQPNRPVKIKSIPEFSIVSLFRDRRGNLWIGTDRGGLCRYYDGQVETLTQDKGLADDEVYAIYEDGENSLWLGTLDGGLHQLRDAKFINFTHQEGLTGDYVQSILQDRNGNIWLGTKSGLTCLEKGFPNNIILKFTKNNPLAHTSVVCLIEDKNSNIWIGTWGNLLVYNPNTKKLKQEILANGNIESNKIQSLLEDRNGRIWIGTNGGLFKHQSGITTAVLKDNGSQDSIVTFIHEDRSGNIIIGTEGGLYKVESQDHGEEIVDFPLHFANTGDRDIPVHFKLRCLLEDETNGYLWLGTDNGLICFDGKTSVSFTVKDGLPFDYVYTILKDNQGNLWMGSRNGITKIPVIEFQALREGKVKRLESHIFNEKDGMSSAWITGNAIVDRQGRYWFPTNEGAAVIHPEKYPVNDIEPQVILESLTIDDKTYFNHDTASNNLPTELDAEVKRLEFRFTALSFVNSQDILFRVILKGYDNDWIAWNPSRNATYTGIPHKMYTFFVEARGRDNGWYGKTEGYTFKKKAHFWEETWFQIMAAVFILTLAGSLYLMRIATLKRREKLLASLVEERTHDLKIRNQQLETARQNILHSKDLIEAKNIQLESQTVQLTEQSEKLKDMDKIKSRFFANISHEFRTPLTLIMGPLEQMLLETETAKDQKKIQLMLRNSQRLLSLINQLLELSRFESGKIKLRAAQQNIIPFLQGLIGNFEPLSEQQELEMTFFAEEEDISLYFDAEKMEHIVGNLLVNAIKFTPAGGRVTLKVNRLEEYKGTIKITVSDTGPGIPREQLPRIFERFYQSESTYENPRRKKGSGIGLALVKELVELHQGNIDVYSHEGRGTDFIITMPLGDSHLKPEEKVTMEAIQKVTNENGHFDTELATDAGEESVHEEDAPDLRAVDTNKSIILVVEDNADVRQYIRGSLESEYSVIEARDGQEGLHQAMTYIPDLIISDIMMPGMDGYELSKQLRADIKTSHIPIIMLTAKASEDSVIRGLETGVDDYITKPFSTNILLARIKNLIELRRQLQLNLNREITFQPDRIAITQIDEQFMKDLRVIISENISDPEFNVEALAGKMHMDRSTVYRKVLALTGETPTEFIRSLRLKRGAELLKKSSITVLEVAFEVGFSSANYFSKCFKKKYHQLPSTYAASESGDQ